MRYLKVSSFSLFYNSYIDLGIRAPFLGFAGFSSLNYKFIIVIIWRSNTFIKRSYLECIIYKIRTQIFYHISNFHTLMTCMQLYHLYLSPIINSLIFGTFAN